MSRLQRYAAVGLVALGLTAIPATPAGAGHNADAHENMDLLSTNPNSTNAINSDLAFWGTRAYAGNYDGFRIFDISKPESPKLLVDFPCFGPQNDPVVWANKLLFLAVDRTLSGPECGSVAVAHDDPTGWEGVRIFDVSNPRKPKYITGVYTDCGAHTITMYPKTPGSILLYVSSYPLRPGPTCGAVRGPEAGRDPLHGVIQVIEVPLSNPAAAAEIAEPPITYPGDPDNQFVWSEHGLPGPPTLEFAARACHDISVNVKLGLAAGACAEQLQLWNVGPDGIPDTANPIWVFDDNVDENGATGDPNDQHVAVDFWHSATFSMDGTVVNGIDESFGDGCPPTTPAINGDTGRMWFVDAATGNKLSHFMLNRPGETNYCSAHMGLPVATRDADLLVNAWYMGGSNVVDFTDPTAPFEVAFYDAAPFGPLGSDNWSAYSYGKLKGRTAAIYASDGVHNTANQRGMVTFAADLGVNLISQGRLNPQTQETLLR